MSRAACGLPCCVDPAVNPARSGCGCCGTLSSVRTRCQGTPSAAFPGPVPHTPSTRQVRSTDTALARAMPLFPHGVWANPATSGCGWAVLTSPPPPPVLSRSRAGDFGPCDAEDVITLGSEKLRQLVQHVQFAQNFLRSSLHVCRPGCLPRALCAAARISCAGGEEGWEGLTQCVLCANVPHTVLLHAWAWQLKPVQDPISLSGLSIPLVAGMCGLSNEITAVHICVREAL